MAATVSASSPWGKKPGAWALDAEEHEEELQRQHNEKEDSAFPSLAAAAATKQPKNNKKLSGAEFANYSSAASGNGAYTSRHTHNEILNLPTGPRQRSAEELDRSRLGGGFKSYCSGRGFGSEAGDDSSNSRSSRFSNREGNRGRDRERDSAPSRADEVEDWSKTKKSVVGYERRERGSGGSFFESQSSKADESDNWVASKAAAEPRRSSNGGFERRGSFDSLSRGRDVSSGGADSDNWGRRKEDGNGTGMGGGERPRYVLQPRTLPVDNGTEAKPKGSSPFGEARPREEVLAEKGKDWKEIDEKLEAVKINNAKEGEKVERRRDRGRFGNEGAAFERSWRKPDSVGSDSRPQSAESTENGHAPENGNSTENSVAEAN